MSNYLRWKNAGVEDVISPLFPGSVLEVNRNRVHQTMSIIYNGDNIAFREFVCSIPLMLVLGMTESELTLDDTWALRPQICLAAVSAAATTSGLTMENVVEKLPPSTAKEMTMYSLSQVERAKENPSTFMLQQPSEEMVPFSAHKFHLERSYAIFDILESQEDREAFARLPLKALLGDSEESNALYLGTFSNPALGKLRTVHVAHFPGKVISRDEKEKLYDPLVDTVEKELLLPKTESIQAFVEHMTRYVPWAISSSPCMPGRGWTAPSGDWVQENDKVREWLSAVEKF